MTVVSQEHFRGINNSHTGNDCRSHKGFFLNPGLPRIIPKKAIPKRDERKALKLGKMMCNTRK